MRIECYSWSDVSEQILEQAIALQNSAFEDMKGNFYQVDIPYKLVLAIDDNQVIGHVAVYLRDVYLDSFPETIGILSCVVVAHKYRGKGVAASLIKMAHAILKEHSVNFSILFAVSHAYYLSSGYIPMKNLTRFIENNEKKEFIYDGGMVCELGSQNWNVNILELNGEVV
ncbi:MULTISPECIES: GNAT family N-acetyltransferase [Proteus]|uniref:Probable acetyltransferase n=3 Tax=Proteus mirabilis TaxID=584 RepID=B4EVX5_PROMH|nr:MULTISPECIES: GNAT family N-acetyltransferase [Proteus]MBA7796111.1 GNAT family N-acetyltransferase [Citrobacter sp. RHBSTW-01065]SSJ67444.1 Predicted acetyltransferase involved in intracellular survival and related acetyltransferases [Klebsiella pneumoniae]ALE22251.1 acetyltransferase [Proteus mirabilis]ALE25391.1 acetyltransferase [Proteus mirabilis]AND13030.1 acetyltransferase [Proteus mirabilis]